MHCMTFKRYHPYWDGRVHFSGGVKQRLRGRVRWAVPVLAAVLLVEKAWGAKGISLAGIRELINTMYRKEYRWPGFVN